MKTRKPRDKKTEPESGGESAKVPDVDPQWTPGVPTRVQSDFTPTPPIEPEKEKIAETPLAETVPTPEPLAASPPPPPVLPPPVVAVAPASNPAIRHFKKINVQMPLYVDKVRIQFEVLDQNIGVIRLDPATSARTIEVLDGFASAKKGGVVPIDEATFTELKKNHPFRTSGPRSQQPKLKVWDNRPKSLIPSVSVGAAAVRSNPLSSVAGGSRGPSASVVGDVTGAGKSPVTFTPNLQRKSDVLKSGVLKVPASGQFRPEANLPPPFPPQSK